MSRNQHPRGFTLLEIAIAVTIMILLIGIAVPAFNSIQADAKAAKILALYNTLRSGCQRHIADTSQTAREYGSAANSAVTDHELSLAQTTASWKGPYIDHPLNGSDNPCGGDVFLCENLSESFAVTNGFQLTGGSGPAITGVGQMVYLSNVPEDIARIVDHGLDKEGTGGDWTVEGRVEWTSANGGSLFIFICTK